MSDRNQAVIEQRFSEILDGLIEQVREDRSVLAAILCGSLSHDTVWEKSDIDLVLVTIDDRKVESSDVALYAKGVNIHAFLLPRADFRRIVEGSVRHSFIHSLLAKGRLLYSHDPSIPELCSRLGEIGERDTQVQLLRAATSSLPPYYKARKWFVTRGDLDYTALWILYAATPLAQVEVIAARRLVDREVIPQAAQLNPSLFKVIYADLLNARKSRKNVKSALDAIERFLAERATTLFGPVLDHLRDAGEARSCSEIEGHFKKNFDLGGMTTACEYLSDQGLIGKASLPVHLTRKSHLQLQELAFFYPVERPDSL